MLREKIHHHPRQAARSNLARQMANLLTFRKHKIFQMIRFGQKMSNMISRHNYCYSAKKVTTKLIDNTARH